MTLCAAWIRQEGAEKELVMATDSRLTGGESWDYGVKLFELPRQDCLLCFAGETHRAYPLILNAISSITFDRNLANPHTDIHDILEYLLDLFTRMVSEVDGAVTQGVGGEAYFLFGGWSWKERDFKIWRLYYEAALESFMHESVDTTDTRAYIFLGDHEAEAEDTFEKLLKAAGKRISGALDMEPLKVLANMSRDKVNYGPIGGAIQIAKIYQSGTREFFGVRWPSVNGRHTFLGRDVPEHDMPPVRFIDPDSAFILEDPLPEKLKSLDEALYGAELEFIEDCYPEGSLKAELTPSERKKLRKILQSAAYRKFLSDEVSEEAALE